MLPPLHVVIVTLDNHLSGAAERAAARFAAEGANITIGFHAASDWDRDARTLDRCTADIARGDIVIATMLFLDDHIRAVLPALEARREACAAMLGLMSGSEIVKLTRMGDYRMDKPAKGPLALLKRLRGSSKPGASSGAKQMKMLRRLPKMLRFIPGTAQDVRAYFLTLQYWLAGSDDNVVGMIRALAHRYAGHAVRADAPHDYPEVGVYHPAIADRMAERIEALPAAHAATGTVGLLMLRSYLLGRDTGHYDGVIAALEAKGLRVIPAFASGLDSRPAIEKFFMHDGRSTVDAVVSLTGFSLVGGPAYNDAAAAETVLTQLDVPYIAAHPIEFQSLQQWGASRQGLLPIEATMMVAIPELDGAILPSVFGGRADGSGEACTGCGRRCTFPESGLTREMQSCPERADALAAKVAKLVALRRSQRAARKLAIVLFNFPPNAGATGTAAHLAVWESLHATLTKLAGEGYDVAVPADVDALRDAVLHGNAARYGADANVHFRISGRRPCPPRTASERDRGAMGPGTRQAAERRRAYPGAGRAVRQRVRRHPARVRLRRRSDAPVVRGPLHPHPRVQRLLPLAARGFRGARGAALRHARRAGVHAGQTGRADRRLLAGAAHRRPAQHLSLCRQQSVRRPDRQAALGGHAGQLSDATRWRRPDCTRV